MDTIRLTAAYRYLKLIKQQGTAILSW